MDEIRLWKLDQAQSLSPLASISALETELQLEDLLAANPELLEPGLELVGRQTSNAGGWLDLLGVNREGRLVIYELKRGTLGRDAVAQVLDYASAIAEMELGELLEHISACSGRGGVQQIDSTIFSAWYEDRFGDLQQLLPARMVLVGLGIDETALRMARFISQGTHELDVVTFYGFRDGGDTLLARQLPVQRETAQSSRSRTLPIDERRQQLQDYLDACGLAERFNSVRDALREQMPNGVFENPLKFGVSLQMTIVGAGGVRGPRPYFGIFAARLVEGVIHISLGSITKRRSEAAYAELAKHVPLRDWPHGGEAIAIASDNDWEKLKPAVCQFAGVVYKDWEQYRNTPLTEPDS